MEDIKYIVCEEPNHFQLKQKKQPKRKEGEALLAVKKVGICGTDLHAFKGNQPFFNYPRVLGHELGCVIIDIDENEKGIEKGDQVIVMPYIYCGKCIACKSGKTNCCQHIKVLGVHTDGGMQDTIVIPNKLLIKANDISLDQITIVEPLAIGAHAIRRAGVKKGDTVTVMGCGPIGIGIIGLCKYLGATVIALDLNESRLKVVKESFGADFTVNVLNNPVEEIDKITNGQLSKHVIDATGNKRAIESGTDYMRHGGNYVLVGLHKGSISFAHPKIHAKETTLLCSRNATEEDFNFVTEALRKGKFNAEAYITANVSYQHILEQFDNWISPASANIKVITNW